MRVGPCIVAQQEPDATPLLDLPEAAPAEPDRGMQVAGHHGDQPACACCYYTQSILLGPDDPRYRTPGWFWEPGMERNGWVWWHGQAPHAPFPYMHAVGPAPAPADEAQAAGAPADAAQAPTEAPAEPAEPTEAPAEPAQAPADLAVAPAEAAQAPTEAPAEPAEPTEAPAEPAQAPAEPGLWSPRRLRAAHDPDTDSEGTWFDDYC